MSQQTAPIQPSIELLVALAVVGALTIWAAVYARGRAATREAGQAPRRRWFRFGVQGLFWLILVAAFVMFLVRQHQRDEDKRRDFETISRLRQELDVQKLRADLVEQQLRDRIEALERQLNDRPQSPPKTP